jgi:hypothetical protein
VLAEDGVAPKVEAHTITTPKITASTPSVRALLGIRRSSLLV